MNMLKRSLAMMLVLCMLIGYVPFNAFASEDGTETPVAPVAETEEVVETTVATVPPTTEETVPPTTEETVPPTTVETVPETTEETVPPTTVETVPETTEETVPETTKETYPQLTMGSLTFVVPGVAEQEVETTTVTPVTMTATPAETYRILHLDCGRKFFTKDWIIALINEMAAAGYTHLELAFGNDGLRFLLDDMSLEANGKSYADATVTAAIQAANQAYYNAGSQNELTQSEMNEIIAHAKSVGIGIIPLLNNPGHMNAVVSTINTLLNSSVGYGGSASTIDLENADAVALTQALVQKYINYFSAKGCNEFNMGADEYANDVYYSGSMGFGALLNGNKYQLFVDYVNTMSNMIKKADMVPIAFNDGIYFQNNTGYKFDTDIMVAYWSSGWGYGTTAYCSASASTMASMGHNMINTNGDYYFILHKDEYIQNPSSTALNFDNTVFMGSTVTNPRGAMFCVWCDNPDLASEQDVAAALRVTMRKMAASMAGTDTYSEEVLEGGFNEDGSINVKEEVPESSEPETSEPESSEPAVTEPTPVVDEPTQVSVKAEGVVGLTVKEVTAPVIEGAAEGKVLAWDMVPTTADGSKYEGEATVAVPVPDGWDVNRMGAFVVEADGVKLIEGAPNADGKFEFTMPHFSEGGTYEAEPAAEAEYDVLVELKYGETSETYTDNTGYYTTAEDLDTKVATVKLGGMDGTQSVTVYKEASATCNNLISSNSSNSWTRAGSYYYTPDGENYYPVYAKRSGNRYYTYYWGYSTTSSASNVTQIGTQQTNNTSDVASITVYTQSTETPAAHTTAAFTGVSVGETTATIGSTTYKIVVRKAAVSAYVTMDAYKTFEDSSTNVAVAESSIASATLKDGVLTITGKAVGTTNVVTDTTVYTVTVTAVDLEVVDDLEIEFWITNHPVQPDAKAGVDLIWDPESSENDTKTNPEKISMELPASTEKIYSENGVALASIVSAQGIDSHTRENDTPTTVVFWKGVALDTTENQQTTDANDNESYNGTDFTRIRYWNDAWQVYNGTKWDTVTDTTQLVAYYLQKTIVTNLDVVQTEVVDWGEVQGNFSWSWNASDFVALDFAIKYEDGTQNPNEDEFAVDGKTLVFHCDEENAGDVTVFRDDNNDLYRQIGTIRATETSNYEVYMITITPNSDDVDDGVASSSGNISDISYDGTEKVVWVDDVANLGEFEDTALQHADFTVGGEPTIQKVDIYNQQSVLITYYVKAKVTEDSLTVHYIDEAAGNVQFYSYNIAVAQGTYFNENIALPNNGGEDPWKGDLVNGTVQTIDPTVTQTVSSDLSTLTGVGAQYLYSEYECIRVETRATTLEDGTQARKDVYLYYTFNPTVTFVADFGLPLEIKATDLNPALDGNVSDMSVPGGSYSEYAQLIDNGTSIIYKPYKVMQDGDFFTILVTTNTAVEGILDEASTQIAFRVYVIPATSVYYEAGFLTNYVGTWDQKGVTSTSNTQATEHLNKHTNNFGYQPGYVTNGQDAETTTVGAEASFNFTGNGFEVFVNSTTDAGFLVVELKNAAGAVQKVYMVNTVAAAGDTGATNDQAQDLDALPAVRITEQDLSHGSYTVTLRKLMDSKPVKIDGFRVFNTIADSTIFTTDLEDKPLFYELRDVVLNAIGVKDDTSDDYGTLTEMIDQVYNQTTDATAIITDESVTYGDSSTIQDLLDNGPKNELFLRAGQTLTFSVKTDRKMQLGMKAPTGTTSYQVTCTDTETISGSIATPIDMFYDLGNARGTEKTYTVSVKNTGSNILSVTLLKICDDPGFAFQALTKGDIEGILQNAGYTNSGSGETTEPETPVEPELPILPETPVEPEEPKEPEVVYADAKLTVNLVDYRGKKQASASITMNGEEGTDAVFSAEAILEAAEAKMPKKYGFVNESAVKDVTVTYGDDATVTVKVGKVATLKVTYINLFGRVKGTATLTKVQNGNGNARFTAAEIKAAAPKGYRVLVGTNVPVSYGSTKSALVTVW